jgi:DNA-binding LytR/AlgR family response regulator
MNKVYNAIIVDDKELDRLAVTSFVRKYPFLKITGTYSSAEGALDEIENTNPDVAFLDIDMPGLSGLELRKKLTHIPACIFITSYPDYAVESFEMAALDFIVKPINAARFDVTIKRLELFLSLIEKSNLFDYSLGGDTIFIKDGYEQVKLNLRDVMYLEALKDYTSVVTRHKKYCVHALLGNLLKEDNFQSFTRIHRSYAVQKNYVDKINGQQATLGEIVLPVGRVYKDAVASIFNS